jgi:molybdenum cofactor synthesis domain-containing protein
VAALRIGVLTVSDAGYRGEREDRSGPALASWAEGAGHEIARAMIVPDEPIEITRTLLDWVDGDHVDVVITTGGTGFGPRDRTPEAVAPLLDRTADAVAAAIARAGAESTHFAPLARVTVGSRGRAVIACLPGSPGGVKDGIHVLAPLLAHLVQLLKGDTVHRAAHDHLPASDDGAS